MKPVFVITGLAAGGAENMLLKLMTTSARFREATVITLQAGGEMLPRFEAAGIRVETLDMHAGIPDPRAVLRLAARIRALGANVVSTWMYHADLMGGLAARLAGVPVAWGIRNSSLGERSHRSTRVVHRACALLSGWVPQRILSCSQRARDLHIAYGYRAARFEVIPNGFDLTRFQPDASARAAVRAELGLGEEDLLVGMFARFDAQKNHEGFLEAAGVLVSAGLPVHFVLAGRQVTADNLQLAEWITTHRLAGRVHCLGERGDIPRLTAALDIACLPSVYGEAFPNVLGEAMASGVPCVTSDVGDAAWIVGDTGWVVQPGDTPALERALSEALRLPRAQRAARGEAARARVAEEFELGVVTQRYEAALAAIARRPKQ